MKKNCLFLLMIITLQLNAQDIIKFKQLDSLLNDTNQLVKIIYVDEANLYYYQSNDISKSIKAVSHQNLSEFQYNSIELGKNKQIIHNDSLLYINYAQKNKIELPVKLIWDKLYSIDLITTNNGERFKVKIISKDSQYVTFKIFDENSKLSKKDLKYPLSLISSLDTNTTYFYGKSFYDNNIILVDKINTEDYYTYYDYIKGFGTTELRVKIINVDDKYITYFLPSDSIISIKQISLNTVKKYKYLSIENNSNTEVIKKDEELYLNYLDSKLKKQENQSKNGYEKSVFASNKVDLDANSIKRNYIPSGEFKMASDNLTYAGVLILGGGLLHLLASRDLSNSSNLTADLNSRSTLAKMGTAMYCVAGIFVIDASINIRNGAINLK